MTGITWLHLSDWHQKGKDFDRQVVLRALLKDIQERKEISPDLEKIDFVIFSGDVAFGGKSEEYQSAKELFFQPVLDACELKPDQLFIVPGNHDLDRDKFELLPGILTKTLSKEKDVQDWLTDDTKRSRLLEPFGEFASFVREYTKQDPPNYANIRRLKVNEKEIALLGLNSAWMCGRNKDRIGDKGFVIIGEPQIHSALEDISKADLRIAILHHPFDWLTEFDCDRIEIPLRQGCDFILRGHQHKPRVEISGGTSGECVIIPAGASWDRRMAKNPRYANSYNFVHLEFNSGEGAVFLRRWSDPRNKWIEDIDSCDGGKCEFNLFGSASQTSSSEKASQFPKIIPHQIPPPPRDFKGRVEDISDILLSFEKGAAITGVRGMGGVGKTALALKLAERIKDNFPDGQIFIDMRGTSTNPNLPALKPEEAMAHVIRAFHPAEKLPVESNELRGLCNTILTNKRVLLLLDNASNAEQVERLLPPAGCSVIITSRLKFTLPGLAEKDLDILPAEEARELLLEIAPRIGDRADELAKLCGYLPLALRNAASALAEKKDLKVSDYEQRLKDKVARLELVKGSFSLSYDLLSPTRRKQWSRLSVFPDDFDRDAAIAILRMPPGPSSETLSDLVRWSLVDYVPATGSEDGRYKLHDLARIFAESCMDRAVLADAQKKHAMHYLKVLSRADDLYQKGGMDLLNGLKLFDLEWANIKVGQAWVKSAIRSYRTLNKSDLKFFMQMTSSYALLGIYILVLRLHPRQIIEWLEAGLKAARISDDRRGEGAALSNLGGAYSHLGEQRKAIEYHERALKISQKIGDRRGEGAALGNLGIAYINLGETRKAIGYHEQALKISQEIGDRRDEGTNLGNLGGAYSHLGEQRKAIEYHEQALKISQEIGDRRGEGAALGNLGGAYSHLGEQRKAIEFYDQVMKISREIGDRVFEGAALGNLGIAYKNIGEPNKAIEFYDEAIKISREIGDRRCEGNNLSNLGNAYLELCEPTKAIEFYDQAMKISREIGDRWGEGNNLGNLGSAYFVLGEPRKAIEFCDQAIKISRKIGDRSSEGNALWNISLALDSLDERSEAIEKAKDALEIYEKIESPYTERVRRQLEEWSGIPQEN